MLTGETVVCLSSIDWDFNWQGHQEIMSWLAERGNRVLFVENTGVRAVSVRDVPRLGRRVRNWWRGERGLRGERERLSVYSPLVLPLPYSWSARWVNRVLMRGAIRSWLSSMNAVRPIVWTFLPTPLCGDLVRDLDAELTVYYCVDDLPRSSSGARRVGESEAELFRTADLVFVTAHKLAGRAAQWRDQVHVFPFGVSYEKFERARTGLEGPPAVLARLGRPLIGFVGAVSHKLDEALLIDVAARMPEVSFALVGPVQCDVAPLRQCPNVHLVGACAHDDVPRYIKAFDAGIIPYRLTPYAEHIYPTKLNEYLAMGIPVVSTPLAEVSAFNMRHGDVVAVAPRAPEFAEALRRALRPGSAAEAERRIAVARQNRWETRLEPMMALITAALARRRAGEGPGGPAPGRPEATGLGAPGPVVGPRSMPR